MLRSHIGAFNTRSSLRVRCDLSMGGSMPSSEIGSVGSFWPRVYFQVGLIAFSITSRTLIVRCLGSESDKRCEVSSLAVRLVYAMAGDLTPVLKMFKCIRVASIFLVRWLCLHAWILDVANVSRLARRSGTLHRVCSFLD